LGADLEDPRGLVGDGRGMPVGLDEEERLRVQREADVRVVLDAADDLGVQELERAGSGGRGASAGA